MLQTTRVTGTEAKNAFGILSSDSVSSVIQARMTGDDEARTHVDVCTKAQAADFGAQLAAHGQHDKHDDQSRRPNAAQAGFIHSHGYPQGGHAPWSCPVAGTGYS